MSWDSTAATRGSVDERDFAVDIEGNRVPGVYWTPASGQADRLVLLGHGGTTHKKIGYIREVANLLCARGIAAMAIDGPGHGDRAVGRKGPGPSQFDAVWKAGGGTARIVADWRAALDFIEAEQGSVPVGWWGLSMGTMMGLPVSASDDRIRVALLGLMGTWGPNGEDLRRMAAEVRCPIRFLVQWDDEVVPRAACLELFELLGTSKKTLHGNPGLHANVPQFEITDSVAYLDSHLHRE